MLKNQEPKTPDFHEAQLSWLSKNQLLVRTIKAIILEDIIESVSLEKSEISAAMLAFKKENNIEKPEQANRFMKKNFLSESEIIFMACKPLKLKKIYERDYVKKAEAKFLEKKSSLDRVIYSLIRVAEPWLARELYIKIIEDEADFAFLANEYSQGPEKMTRGIIGPVALNQAHPKLAKVLQTSPPGFVTSPFQVQQWWIILRIESYSPAILDESTRIAIAKELFQEWLQEEASAKVSQLSNRTKEITHSQRSYD